MTTPIPDEAVTAAAVALHDEDCDDGDTSTCGRWNSSAPGGYDPRRHTGYYEDRARKVLEAAAPVLAAAERKRLAADPPVHDLALAVQRAWDEEFTPVDNGVDYRQARIAVETVLAQAAPVIAAAERQKLYEELGNDHYVIFTEDGWTTEHSVECRLSGHMHECAYHDAASRFVGRHNIWPAWPGRWLITAIDDNGEPVLVRAELTGEDSSDE
jgi:hypothetical protein